MPLSDTFSHVAPDRAGASPTRGKRPAPFSLRLSEAERARLIAEAGDTPLGAYIKAKVLGERPLHRRRAGAPVQDKKSLAQALALLGRARLANNLNQLAHAANIGVLPLDPETMADINAALSDLRDLRRLLLAALGKKVEALS